MAIRTTPAAVQAILGYNWDGTTDLTPFIATASALVDIVVAKDTSSMLGTTLPELIERWLAGHFYGMSDQMFNSKSVGGASGSFQVGGGAGLQETMYGRQALCLDITRYLAALNNKGICNAYYIGGDSCGCSGTGNPNQYFGGQF